MSAITPEQIQASFNTDNPYRAIEMAMLAILQQVTLQNQLLTVIANNTKAGSAIGISIL